MCRCVDGDERRMRSDLDNLVELFYEGLYGGESDQRLA